MQIDWQTVIFQIVNFLIVIFVLKKFAFDKILKAIKERQKNITSRFEEAEKKKLKAEEEAESYHKKKQELENSRQEMLEEAKNDAEKSRKELMDKARASTDDLREKWHESVKREKESFLADLRKRIGSQVYAIARKALKDLSTYELEKQLITSFAEKMRELKEDEIKIITEPIAKSGGKIIVRSAFELTEDDRRRIDKELREKITKETKIEYTKSPEVIAGIEMNVDGHKLAWSIGDYLNVLENELSRDIDRLTAPKPVASTKSSDDKPENLNKAKNEQPKKDG